MPWEKSFDANRATNNAMNVFWSKGYEATSLADLLQATGINKGSFYNAFGSKRALFTQCLINYERGERRAMLTELAALKDPVQAIKILFDRMIEQSMNDPEKKGCFLVNTALDLPNQDAEISRTVRSGFNDLETFFRERILAGQRMDVISESVNPTETAKGLLTLAVGLRVLARGVFDSESLKVIKHQAILLLG